MQGGIFPSEGKGYPPNMAQDAQNKENYHERKTTQLLGFGKCSYPGYNPMVINFQRKNGEYFGMQIGDVSCQPTSFQKMKRDTVEGRFDSLMRTSHPNLLNLLSISACEGDVLLHHEKPGIPLTQIRQSKILDRIEVATVCRKILYGLIYIHEVLNIGHGNLHCDNIYLMDDGEIKIGDIGKSMVQGKTKDVSCDVQAVYKIADQLLNLNCSSDATSLSLTMARSFVAQRSDINPRTVLQHPFFRISQDSWYLSGLWTLFALTQATALDARDSGK